MYAIRSYYGDYKNVSDLATTSISYSEYAISKAKTIVINKKEDLKIRIENINDRINFFKKNFGRFPMSTAQRNEFNRCNILFLESHITYKRKDYTICT